MATRDTAGKLHLGVFEQPQLPDVDAKISVKSGRGHYANVQATGPDATSSDTWATRAATPRDLQYSAQAHGAVATPATDDILWGVPARPHRR